ncbi:MAG: sacsin N-terminal ATP-binding-like domain-containing protein [Bradymonadia bacterium]
MNSLPALEGLPFAEVVTIVDAVARDADAQMRSRLLETLSRWPDHEPLARCVLAFADAGALGEPWFVGAVAEALSDLSDAGVARLLGPMTGEAWGPVVAEAAARTPIHRVTTFSLLIRWLSRHTPERWRLLVDEAVQQVEAALRSGDVDALPDGPLMCLPGRSIEALVAGAPSQHAAFRDRRGRLAKSALEALAAIPRSASQAGAEALLSQKIYTDPGHWLVELVQNAEDAGATCWHIEAHQAEGAVHVIHDGAPFDLRDVVGVLSIGQTTKGKGQIGMFGVGFKAVYAISERPRLYTDVYAFEIADVSIPRPVTDRTPEEHLTRLILPLRQPDDAEMGLDAMWHHAQALPPSTLLALRSIRTFRWIAPDGRQREVRRVDTEAGARLETRLSGEGEAQVEHWRLAQGKAGTLVAVQTDDAGCPVPLPEVLPQVFCHLPTGARPGWGIMVHGAFELPVDRERLDPSRDTNQRLLIDAGEALAGLALNLPPSQRRALLGCLRSPRRLSHPGWAALGEAFKNAVGDAPMVVDAVGESWPVSQVILGPAALAEALAGLPLDAGGARLIAEGDTADEVLLWLGARRWSPEVCTTALAHLHLAGPPRLEAIEGLLHWVDATARQKRFSETQLQKVQATPWLIDVEEAWCAPSKVYLADALTRALVGSMLPLVHEGLAEALSPRGWRRLGPKFAGVSQVVALLEHPERGPELGARPGFLPWLRAHEGALGAEAAKIAPLPIFPAEREALAPLTGAGALWIGVGDALERFVADLVVRPPLARLDDPAHRHVLARLGGCTLTSDVMAEALLRGSVQLDDEALIGLHRWLAEVAEGLSTRQLKRWAKLPIHLDTVGRRRALVGAERVAWPEDESISGWLPDGPWIDPRLGRMPHLKMMGITVVSTLSLAQALAGDASSLPPAIDTESDAGRRGLLVWLSTRPRAWTDFDEGLRRALAEAPIWPDNAGALAPLSTRRPPPSIDRVARVYAEIEAAGLTTSWAPLALGDDELAEGARRLVEGLSLAEYMGFGGDDGLIADMAELFARSDVTPWPPSLREAITDALKVGGLTCSEAALATLSTLPWWPDTDGRWCTLGGPQGLVVPGSLRPAMQGGPWPLLDADVEHDRWSLIERLGITPITLDEVVTGWRGAALPEQSAEALRAVVLSADLSTFGAAHVLPELVMWQSASGVLEPAKALIIAEGLMDHGLSVPDAVRLDPVQGQTVADAGAPKHGPPLGFASPDAWLLEQVQRGARWGVPLDAQPPWLSTVAQVALLADALGAGQILTVDAEGRLQSAPVHAADADTVALAVGLPLSARLAHPDWPHPEPPLPPRRLLQAMAQIANVPTAPEAHPVPALRQPEGRQSLYRWLLRHGAEITQDEQARGALGAAAVCLSAGGVLQRPRDLLWRTLGVVDLHIADDQPHGEIPEPLRRWLGAHMITPQGAVRRVAERLLDAHEEAMGRADVEASVRLVRGLAHVLSVDAAEEGALVDLIKRLKLHRRLKVADVRGGFTRPKDLLSPADDAQRHLIETFMQRPPPGPSDVYDTSASRRLIQLAGAEGALDTATLGALLDGRGRVAGDEARVALALYLCHRVETEKGLVDALDLRRRSWMPAVDGRWAEPSSLYWPTEEVVSMLGPGHGKLVSEALARAFGAESGLALGPRLGCRGADGLVLRDVLDAHQEAAVTPSAVLQWIDDALGAGHLSTDEVRAASDRLTLLDDDDTPRAPGALIRDLEPGRYGPWRGGWRQGRKLSRLTSALGIPTQAGFTHHRRVLAWVFESQQRDGRAWLIGTSDWDEIYLELMGDLAAADEPPPQPWGLVVQHNGESLLWPVEHPLIRTEDPSAVVRTPPGLDTAPWREWLAHHGAFTAPAQIPQKQAPSPAIPASAEAPKEGLWSSLRRLLGGQGEDRSPAQPPPSESNRAERHAPERSAPPTPPRGDASGSSAGASQLPDDRRWFQQREAIRPQIGARTDWLDDRHRISRYGLAFRPGRLPAPYTYGPLQIAGTFHRRSQRWSPRGVDPQWATPGEGGPVVTMRGRMPGGVVQLPLPLYGKLLKVTGEDGRVIEFDGATLRLEDDVQLTCEVALAPAPAFGEETTAPTLLSLPSHKALWTPTVPDDELPEPCHALVDAIALEGVVQRIKMIRAFIAERYRYDPKHLEDPRHARWLAKVSEGRANVHLAMLHAGRDAHHLGRGICYELNTLACELLRRSGIPAALATGWTFDRGQVDEPDHLWAMALLDSPWGPRWMPVDASTTRSGRPIHARPRSAGIAPPEQRPEALPETPSWAAVARGQRHGPTVPLNALLAVARHVSEGKLDEATARARCQVILADPDARAALRDVLRL